MKRITALALLFFGLFSLSAIEGQYVTSFSDLHDMSLSKITDSTMIIDGEEFEYS
ncbi:MAG: hypothetical protein F6K39_18345, partial [Okeania sp. SIO3B3]|nr:hypothetical protein [Okeania sp. SIO3B3]